MNVKVVLRRSGARRPVRGKGRFPWWRRPRTVLAAVAVAALAAGIWLVWPFWQLVGSFADRAADAPSRLYAAAPTVEAGRMAPPDRLVELLEREGYRAVDETPRRPGQLALTGNRLAVWLRPRPTPEGWRPAERVGIRFRGQRVVELTVGGRPATAVRLEPPLLATFLGPELAARRPIELGELPDHLVRAVLAAEDANFFRHPGLSLSGILRAAWVNATGGTIRQGGSTLTQQLVKNLYLTHERTLVRKLREMAIAVMVDLRYDKREILEAYLNEIYWGVSGPVNVMGVGAAAWAYFGKHPGELELDEAAFLAGMIQSPGGYSPTARPERARERRNWVLGRMVELGWLDAEAAAAAAGRPLGLAPRPVGRRQAAWFADRAAEEARRRFGVSALESGGHLLLSTLDWAAQRAAEESVAWGLEALEEGWERDRKPAAPLQAALVSIEPSTGAILAYVGGRDYRASQFDRAGRARRQAGSAFKPVVYAAAFELGVASPAGIVDDSPLTVELAGRRWTPQNSSDEYRGWVTVRTAMEQSLNVPTVRLAMRSDLDQTIALARRMGVTGRLDPVPALALGAFEVTPVELATVYATLASGGLRPEPHALEAVFGADGAPLGGAAPQPPDRALSAETAYLVTSLLQGVLDRGTGRSVRQQGVEDALAGKTGTTNDRRDSWFGGYSPDRATLVWVGYDDNSATRLGGARAALPIWGRFTYAVRPPGGYRYFEQPPGIVTAVVDPLSGELATGACPRVLTEVFRDGQVPLYLCRLHSRGYEAWRTAREAVEERGEERRRRRWRWLQKVLGRGGGG